MIEEPAPAKRTGTTRQAGSPWWQSPDTEHERGDPPDPPFDDPDDEPFDDADDEYPPTRRSGAGRRRPEDLRASLREAVADRVPPALRPGRATIPLRAALAAMLIAVALGAALLARADAAAGPGTTVPARAVAGRPAAYRGSVQPTAAQAIPPATEGSLGPSPAAPGPSPMASAAWLGAWSGQPAGQSPAVPGGLVVVDVVGLVRHPGLVRLPAGSRIWDAVLAAGGPSGGARMERVNLARPLSDGEQIRVPGPNDPIPPVAAQGAGQPGSGAAGAGGGVGGAGRPAGSPVDLNAATATDLDTLPGVGPVLAGRIVAWRSQHGRFTRIEELGEVQGIGDKMFAQLRPLVRV